MEDICADGFNRIYGGDKNGMLFGQGTYFARDFDLSSKYAEPPDSCTKLKQVLLCQVLTGAFTQGYRNLKVLPINPANGAKFHSAVNKTENPSIFAIFHDSAAVPLYLISYSEDSNVPGIPATALKGAIPGLPVGNVFAFPHSAAPGTSQTWQPIQLFPQQNNSP